MRDIHHEKSEVSSIRHAVLGDVHEILQAPMLLSIAEVKLNLEPQAIVSHHFLSTQIAIGAEQNNVSMLVSGEMRFDDNDNVEPIGIVVVIDFKLIDIGAIIALNFT